MLHAQIAESVDVPYEGNADCSAKAWDPGSRVAGVLLPDDAFKVLRTPERAAQSYT